MRLRVKMSGIGSSGRRYSFVTGIERDLVAPVPPGTDRGLPVSATGILRILGLLFVMTRAVLVPGTSEAAQLLTIHDALRIALGESPELKATEFDLLSAEYAIRTQKAALLPELSAAASFQAFSGSPVGPFALVNVRNPDELGRATASEVANAASSRRRRTT